MKLCFGSFIFLWAIVYPICSHGADPLVPFIGSWHEENEDGAVKSETSQVQFMKNGVVMIGSHKCIWKKSQTSDGRPQNVVSNVSVNCPSKKLIYFSAVNENHIVADFGRTVDLCAGQGDFYGPCMNIREYSGGHIRKVISYYYRNGFTREVRSPW